MNYCEIVTDNNRGQSRHSSLEDTEKAARWLENTLSGMLASAKEQTDLTDFQILASAKVAIRKNSLEVKE